VKRAPLPFWTGISHSCLPPYYRWDIPLLPLYLIGIMEFTGWRHALYATNSSGLAATMSLWADISLRYVSLPLTYLLIFLLMDLPVAIYQPSINTCITFLAILLCVMAGWDPWAPDLFMPSAFCPFWMTGPLDVKGYLYS